jgi:hypothetical protein
MTDDVLDGMLRQVMSLRDRIDTRRIMPRVRWSNGVPLAAPATA